MDIPWQKKLPYIAMKMLVVFKKFAKKRKKSKKILKNAAKRPHIILKGVQPFSNYHHHHCYLQHNEILV